MWLFGCEVQVNTPGAINAEEDNQDEDEDDQGGDGFPQFTHPDFTPQNDEQLIIPDVLLKELRRTVVEIKLEYNPNIMNSAQGGFPTNQLYDGLNDHFDAVNSHKFTIKHPELVVQDSLGTEFPLEIYLLPEKNSGRFMIWVSLNQIAINFVHYNMGQTAYYLRKSITVKILSDDSTTNILNKSYLHPSANYDLSTATWHPASIEFHSGGAEIDGFHQAFKRPVAWVNPCYNPFHSTSPGKPSSMTAFPCYDPYGAVNAEVFDDYQHLILQPIAPVGYKHFDWNTYDYKRTDTLGNVLNTLIPHNIFSEHHAIALEETREKFSSIKNQLTARDIGWFGLPPDYRNQIARAHPIFIDIYLKENTAIAAQKLQIPANGITVEQINDHEPSSGAVAANTEALTLEYVVEDPGEPFHKF